MQRRLRFAIAILGIVFSFGQTAAADDATIPWSGVGWYVTVSSGDLFEYLIKGPYQTEQQCYDMRPAQDEWHDYFCRFLETDPAKN